MTLFKKLMVLIVSLFIICLSGTLYLTFQNSKEYYLEQLRANAQDTATSLGVSLSSHISDKPYMLSMVDAVFDRGYFEKISILAEDETLLLSREQLPNYSEVPQWFVSFVKLPMVEKKSLILTGWKEVGEIRVKSDPSFAYIDLWKTSLELFYWFLGLLFIFLIILYIGMNILFKPLYHAVDLARSICRSEFRILDNKPRTPELRMLIDALNKMVFKLKELFKANAEKISSLQKELFVDGLTGYGNRSYFEQNLVGLLNDETLFVRGALIFIEISGLKEYNNQYGFEKGNELILKTKIVIERHFKEEQLLLKARITGSTFALMINELDKSVIDGISAKVLRELEFQYKLFDERVSAEMGASFYQFKQARTHVLSSVDKALTSARNQGTFTYFFEEGDTLQSQFSAKKWRELLQDAITNKAFQYFSQPVLSIDNRLFHKEIFIKLPFSSEKSLTAGDFLPLAEKFSFTPSIDGIVLDAIMANAGIIETPLSLNLSYLLLAREDNRSNYLKKLLKNNELIDRVHFEISEHIIKRIPLEATKMIKALAQAGFSVGIDRVGGSLIDLAYLSELNVSFIKVDGSITRGIVSSPQKQETLKTLMAAAHSLELTVIAANVESEEQWNYLINVGIIYAQGQYFSEPREELNA